jgi:phasin family protein
MFSFPEQLSVAARANLDAQLSMMAVLTKKAFESVEKVVDLNMNVVRSSLNDSIAATKQLLDAKDPQDFFTLTAAQAQPSAEKVIAYSRYLFGIATSTQAEFAKAAEAQIAETNRKAIAMVDDVSRNAPAGSENAIALMKSALSNANAGYEQLSKNTRQAVEAMETNMTSAVTQFSQAAEKTTSRAKK